MSAIPALSVNKYDNPRRYLTLVDIIIIVVIIGVEANKNKHTRSNVSKSKLLAWSLLAVAVAQQTLCTVQSSGIILQKRITLPEERNRDQQAYILHSRRFFSQSFQRSSKCRKMKHPTITPSMIRKTSRKKQKVNRGRRRNQKDKGDLI